MQSLEEEEIEGYSETVIGEWKTPTFKEVLDQKDLFGMLDIKNVSDSYTE